MSHTDLRIEADFPPPEHHRGWRAARNDWQFYDPSFPIVNPAASLYSELPTIGPMTELGAFVLRVQQRHQGMLIDGVAFMEWEQHQKEAKIIDHAHVRTKRKKDIKDRLLQIEGWFESDFGQEWLEAPPRPVNVTAPLTDRSFSSMLSTLTEWRDETRAQEAEQARKEREVKRREVIVDLHDMQLES